MKCPKCSALIEDSDPKCFSCGLALKPRGGTGSLLGGLISGPTPVWAWLCVGLCALIPVVALGGLIPVFLGFAGTLGCLGIARSNWLPEIVRFAICLIITVACWVAFIVLCAGILEAWAN